MSHKSSLAQLKSTRLHIKDRIARKEELLRKLKMVKMYRSKVQLLVTKYIHSTSVLLHGTLRVKFFKSDKSV